MTNIIREKIELLEDFCIIKRRNDERRKLIRQALKECGSEFRMEQMLHDVIRGKVTIETVLQQKGLM